MTQKDSKKKIVSKREKKGRASLLELTHQTHISCHEIKITLLKKKHETNFKKISKLSNEFEKKNKLIKK
jgi:hypothetical protein